MKSPFKKFLFQTPKMGSSKTKNKLYISTI